MVKLFWLYFSLGYIYSCWGRAVPDLGKILTILTVFTWLPDWQLAVPFSVQLIAGASHAHPLPSPSWSSKCTKGDIQRLIVTVLHAKQTYSWLISSHVVGRCNLFSLQWRPLFREWRLENMEEPMFHWGLRRGADVQLKAAALADLHGHL